MVWWLEPPKKGKERRLEISCTHHKMAFFKERLINA